VARPSPGAATPAPVAQQASGLQTAGLAAAASNPIKTALLERLRAKRQGQEPEKK
jgi:hypothetical protein